MFLWISFVPLGDHFICVLIFDISVDCPPSQPSNIRYRTLEFDNPVPFPRYVQDNMTLHVHVLAYNCHLWVSCMDVPVPHFAPSLFKGGFSPFVIRGHSF